jgi:predicted nucleic acid-binding protein
MIIVSDTSVITNLKQIGYLEILEKLFKRVIVPKKVAPLFDCYTLGSTIQPS